MRLRPVPTVCETSWVLDRLRLHRDPTLYAPSYAVLLGVFVSSVVGMQTTQSNLVGATAQIVLGVTVVLTGVHSIVYRHEHTELMRERFRLKNYRPLTFVLVGIGLLFIGLATAALGYFRL
jgi:uncharacterized membrane protein YidH (DUF202 family)